MMAYCGTCKCNTRHRWNGFTNRFECIRQTKEHGWSKQGIMENEKERLPSQPVEITLKNIPSERGVFTSHAPMVNISIRGKHIGSIFGATAIAPEEEDGDNFDVRHGIHRLQDDNGNTIAIIWQAEIMDMKRN